MFNATPLPSSFTQKETGPKSSAPSLKATEPNYVGIGAIGGFVIALLILGGIYYKMKLDLSAPKSNSAQVSPMPTQAVSTASSLPSPTPSVVVTPFVIQSAADLSAAENIIDETDFTSLSSDLEKNMKDATDFTE